MISILKTKKDIHEIRAMILDMKSESIGNLSKTEFLANTCKVFFIY